MKIRWNVHRLCWEVVDLASFRPLASFSTLQDAERWQVAESKRREIA